MPSGGLPKVRVLTAREVESVPLHVVDVLDGARLARTELGRGSSLLTNARRVRPREVLCTRPKTLTQNTLFEQKRLKKKKKKKKKTKK